MQKNIVAFVFLISLFYSLHAEAIAITTLHSFTYDEDGNSPVELTLSRDGSKLYGSTEFGGIFALSLDGSNHPPFAIITKNPSHQSINGRLTLSADGQFLYGAAGTFEQASIFKLALNEPHHAITLLHQFDLSHYKDGMDPIGGLLLSKDGNTLYGVTASGGLAGSSRDNSGIIYQLDLTTQQLTILYSFSGKTDGGGARAGLIMSHNGKTLYGTTKNGGRYNLGTVFQYSLDGQFTTLHSFGEGDEGALPTTELTLSHDGHMLYGATAWSNANGGGYGAIYQIEVDASKNYPLKILHRFTGYDGAHPQAGLVLSHDGTYLYGSTAIGEKELDNHLWHRGTLFAINLAKEEAPFVTLYTFKGWDPEKPDGDTPLSPLLQNVDGTLLGTTKWGGVYNRGMIFQVDSLN